MRFSDFLDNEVAEQPAVAVPTQPEVRNAPNTSPDCGDGLAQPPSPLEQAPLEQALLASPRVQAAPGAPSVTYEHVLGPPPSGEPSPFAELLSPPTPMPPREALAAPQSPRDENAELEAILEAIIVAPEPPAAVATSIDDDLLPTSRKAHGRRETQAPRAWSFGRSKR